MISLGLRIITTVVVDFLEMEEVFTYAVYQTVGYSTYMVLRGIKGLFDIPMAILLSYGENPNNSNELFFVDLGIHERDFADSEAWKKAGLNSVNGTTFKESTSLLCALKSNKLPNPDAIAVIYKIFQAQGNTIFGEHTSLVFIKNDRAAFTRLGKRAYA